MPANDSELTGTAASAAPDASAPRIARREFLAICGALPLLATGCAGARYLTPTRQGDQLVIARVELARTGAVLIEDPSSDLPIYLRRVTESEFIAVSTKCGHRGCQVEPAAASLVCPCHGSEYTFEGAILQGPTERPLARFRVTSDATNVYVHLGAAEPR
ncbi:MAG: Rieske (2Fe-2S) protein [Gemmatimonadota bacterium]